MKLYEQIIYIRGRGRTFTGAWIETGVPELDSIPICGRTFTGAWIETNFMHLRVIIDQSHLYRCVD